MDKKNLKLYYSKCIFKVNIYTTLITLKQLMYKAQFPQKGVQNASQHKTTYNKTQESIRLWIQLTKRTNTIQYMYVYKLIKKYIIKVSLISFLKDISEVVSFISASKLFHIFGA